MIMSGWNATVANTLESKWLLFIISFLFFMPILYKLLYSIKKNTELCCSKEVVNLYNFLSLYLIFVWCGYPTIWLLHSGFNIVDINIECIIHTILDFFAKDLFGFILIYNHSLFEKNKSKILPFDEQKENIL